MLLVGDAQRVPDVGEGEVVALAGAGAVPLVRRAGGWGFAGLPQLPRLADGLAAKLAQRLWVVLLAVLCALGVLGGLNTH